MTMQFRKATKAQARARMALIGPAGSGKTYTALAIASHLGSRVAVIDTERGSASKYAGLFDFDVLELETFGPLDYVEAIRAAESAGYDVIVVDSLSHAWAGKGGALELVDAAAKRSQSRSTFSAWRDVTPQHHQMVDAIIGARAHVIATMRTKTEYVQEKDDRGKTVVRKLGLQPVQRDGLEYEFDVVADLTQDNDLIVGKTRCPALSGKVFTRAGEDVAGILRAWLSDGSPAEEKAPESGPRESAQALPDFVALLAMAESQDQIADVSRAVASAIRAGKLTKGSPEYLAILDAATSAKARLSSAQEEPGANG